MEDSGMEEINWGRFEGWSALRCEKVKDILFTPTSKTLNKLDVLKQQSSKFTEMTSEFYVSI